MKWLQLSGLPRRTTPACRGPPSCPPALRKLFGSTVLCALPCRGPLTTRGRFYWAVGGRAGLAQGSRWAWGWRWGSSTVWLETRARGPGRKERGSGRAGRGLEGGVVGSPGPPLGRQVALAAGGGSSNWYWAAGQGRKQRRSRKGNIRRRRAGARCCHLHKRKKQSGGNTRPGGRTMNESKLKKSFLRA